MKKLKSIKFFGHKLMAIETGLFRMNGRNTSVKS